MPIHEKTSAAHFLAGQAGTRSQDTKVVQSDGPLPAGQVLAQPSNADYLVPLNATASDGSETPAAILYAPKSAGGEARHVVINRDAVVASEALDFNGATDAQQIAALNALASRGIRAR